MKVHLQIIPYDFDEQALGNVPFSMIGNGRLSTIRMNKADMGTPFDERLQIPIVWFS
jgi:hypothetical protein